MASPEEETVILSKRDEEAFLKVADQFKYDEDETRRAIENIEGKDPSLVLHVRMVGQSGIRR